MSEIRDPILFHVGYHKTATTWMQFKLFVPRHGYRPLADHDQIFHYIVQPHGLYFDAAEAAAFLRARMDAAAPGEVPVVSSEIMSGHPFQGGRGSDVYAERIKAIAPRARILLSIRAQLRILPSIYMQYLLRGGTMPPDVFFTGTDEPGYFGFDARHFEYDRLVSHYQRLFGRENVLVVAQEGLKSDMDGTADAIARFSGNALFESLSDEDRMVEAPSFPEHAIPVLRRINHARRSVLNPAPALALSHSARGPYKAAAYALNARPFARLLGGNRPVSDYVRRNFTGRYAESNARLARIVAHPVDLSAYEGAGDGPTPLLQSCR